MKHNISFLFDYVFPNGYVPNASMPELTLINYLNSFHNKMITESTFLESQPDVFNKIFQSQLGNTPNSLSQFFYKAPCYSNHIEIHEDSVFYGSQRGEKFIYPIKPNPVLGAFFAEGLPDYKKQNGNYFWKYIPDSTMEKIIRRQGFILVDYTMEPFIDREMYDKIHDTLKYSNIPNNSIIIAVNSLNAKELYETWYPKHERKLQILNLPFCLDYSSWFYNNAISSDRKICMNIQDFVESKNNKRPHYFLFKSRQPRLHRCLMLYHLHKNNLLEKGNWSFLSTTLADLKKFDIATQDLMELRKLIPHTLQNESFNINTQLDAWSDKSALSYLSSYFEICMESIDNSETISFTEKVFVPLINFQPFFLVSSAGALNKLKELGFKTFSPYIDESYDSEPDLFKRTLMISKEIERLCNLTTQEIHDWYWNMQDILVHNHNTLINYHKNPLGLESIKFLYELTRS